MEWYFFAIASAAISGLVPSVNKAILRDGDALPFSATVALLNAAISLPLVFVVPLAMPIEILLLLLVGSVFGTLGFLHISKSMKLLPVSVVSPLTNFNPVVLVVLASFILGERLELRQLAGIAIVLIGAYRLERVAQDDKPKRIVMRGAFLLAFASAVFYGLSSVIDKAVLSVVSPLQYLLVAHVFIAANFAILSGLGKAGPEMRRLFDKKRTLFLISSALTIAYRLLQAAAVSLAPVSLVIPIRHTNSLISTAIGGKLFSEGRLPEKLAIGAMMVAGTYFIML